MSEQIMQVEVRCVIIDIDTGQRSEVSHEDHCEELLGKSWGNVAYDLGQRMLERTVVGVAGMEQNRMASP